jgi:hypothetical protein
MAQSRAVTVAYVVTPLALLGLLVYAILQMLHGSSGSPIEVVGGSIYVLGSGQQWNRQGSDQLYTTAMPASPGEIHTKGVGSDSAIPDLKGWVITLSSRDPAKNRKPEEISICSDQACDGNELSQLIYLNTKSDSRWAVNDKGELHFHDKTCDGDTGTTPEKEDRTCDFLVDVTIESPRGTVVASGACKRWFGSGHCKIGIGPHKN